MPIDFDSFFRNRIEGLLIRASWVGEVRRMLGLTGVSQVWDGQAAWYFWLQGAPGVYALVFMGGDRVESDGGRFYEGRFALKCYPYPDQPTFGGFSNEERKLIRSGCFDATLTPRFEAAAAIPDSLFTVGSVSLLCDGEENLALLTYQSLDALRVVRCSAPSKSAGARRHKASRRLLRNVAGWAMGYPFFDCLIGLYAHSVRQPPAFVGATRGPGFEYAVLTHRRSECRPSRRTAQTALTIGFQCLDGGDEQMAALWHDRLGPDEKILAAGRLPASIHREAGWDLAADIILNPLWWDIAAADFKSELTSTCGCSEAGCCHSANAGFHER